MKYYLGFLLLIISGFSSCGKKIVPSMSIDVKTSTFDTATFENYYVEAIRQKLTGNGGDALRYFEQCIKINPASDGTYYQMAQILINNRDIKTGKKFVEKALSLDHKNIWYLIMLSGIYYQENNIDSAIICYEKAIDYFPDKEYLQITLGNLYSERKDYDKAVSIFNSLEDKYGVSESYTLAAIKNLMAAEKYDEALKKTQLITKEYPDEILYNGLLAEIYRDKGEREKARELYDQIIEKYPDNAQAQLSLCDFLIKEKSFDELFLLLNTIILNNKIGREDKVALIVKLFDQQEIINDKEDHLMLAIMVLEANYKEDDIYPLLRPELLIKQNKLDEAEVRLEEIIKMYPNNYYAWEKLLFVYLQVKDYDNLFKKGEACATLFNRSFIAKILYANGAAEKEKYGIALEELKKAEILAGDNRDSLLQVLNMRADVYYKMKEFKKAFETFEQALKINKDDLILMNNYAYYLAEQDMHLRTAEKMARQVIEIDGENTTYLDTYGWVLYKTGKLKEAAKIMEKIIIKGEEQDAVWYEHYGFILKKQKKCNEAIKNWNIAMKIDSTKTNLIKEIENCEK